jgi:X-X-X-Leu-X-X-Gly heptad repeat protein
MNRSILIVIADFLLISLLAFSSFDADKLTQDQPAEKSQLALQQAADTAPTADQDLMGALKLALADEQRARQEMVGELSQTKESIRGQQNALVEREKQFAALQQGLQNKDQQTRQLEQERNALQHQVAVAQTNLLQLQEQLKATAAGASVSKEKLEATEAALRKEQAQAALAQQRLAEVERGRQALESEKQQLSQRLQVTEAEKRLTAQQLANLQGEVKTVQTEKAQLLQHADKLAEGVSSLAQSSDKLADRVTTLANNSGELTKEVREYRPMAANAIFSDFAANRVHARFHATRTGIFGLERNKHKETETILVTDGTNTFALCHVDDTPFALWTPGTDWEWLTGTLGRATAEFPIDQMAFYLLDPRAVLIPVSDEHARQLGCRVYHLAHDPFKFQDAILVGAREGYYGECKFQIDLSTPQYVKMDRGVFRGLFGKFNPSRGDMVFSMTGELLGIMANSTYCIVIHNFKSGANLQFGEGVRAQNTAELLSRLSQQVNQLPFKLR